MLSPGQTFFFKQQAVPIDQNIKDIKGSSDEAAASSHVAMAGSITEADISTSPDSMGGRLADGFANLLRSLWGGSYTVVSPGKLRELINESPELNQLLMKQQLRTSEHPGTELRLHIYNII